MVEAPAAEPDDDMHDPGDRSKPFPLGEYLTLCDPCAGTASDRPCLRKAFEDADRDALESQGAFNGVVRTAAVMGVVAMLLGLAQRLWSEHAGVTWIAVDFGITALALFFVLKAMISAKHEKWLSERFRAEQLRLLKFKHLIDPRLWDPGLRDLTPWKNRLETGQREIANQTDEVLDALKVSDSIPDLPATDDCLAVDVPALRRLLDYYRRKRLGAQLQYFEGKMHRKMAIANPRLPAVFFFVGIVLVLFSDFAELVTNLGGARKFLWPGLVLVLLAFAVPMGWNAIRIIRGAFEFNRNAARSHARHAALADISRSLDAATERPPERWDRPQIFGYLHLCEGVLASDQHEWIRLMKDVEWHG